MATETTEQHEQDRDPPLFAEDDKFQAMPMDYELAQCARDLDPEKWGPRLICSSLIDRGIEIWSQNLSRLRGLSLAGSCVSSLGLRDLFHNCPHLTFLSLTNCTRWDGTAFQDSPPSSFQHLERLFVERCYQLNDQDLRIIADACPQLRMINLAFCLRVTSHTLSWLSHKCLKLQGVDWRGCHSLLRACRDLHEMNFFFSSNLASLRMCCHLTDDLLNRLVRSCPQLQKIRLWRCSMCSLSVTEEGLWDLLPLCRARSRSLHLELNQHLINFAQKTSPPISPSHDLIYAVSRNCHLTDGGQERELDFHVITRILFSEIKKEIKDLNWVDFEDLNWVLKNLKPVCFLSTQMLPVSLVIEQLLYHSRNPPLRCWRISDTVFLEDRDVLLDLCRNFFRTPGVSLEQFDLINCLPLFPELLTCLFINSPRLQSLTVVGSSSHLLTEAIWMVLARNCPSLRHLDLRDYSSVSCAGLKFLVARASHLETLDLRNNRIEYNHHRERLLDLSQLRGIQVIY